MRGSARIYDVRMAQFVPKIEKLSHIMGPRASQDLRSPSLIMTPDSKRLSKYIRGDFAECKIKLSSFIVLSIYCSGFQFQVLCQIFAKIFISRAQEPTLENNQYLQS